MKRSSWDTNIVVKALAIPIISDIKHNRYIADECIFFSFLIEKLTFKKIWPIDLLFLVYDYMKT